jgi:hypothetical protein
MTSISDIASSELSQLALQRWPSAEAAAASRYDATLVQHIYHRYLMPSGPASGRGAGSERVSPRQLLEYSSYLEFYLWQHYSDSVPFEHAMSIVIVSVGAGGLLQYLPCAEVQHRTAAVCAPAPLLIEWHVRPIGAARRLLGWLMASAALLRDQLKCHRLSPAVCAASSPGGRMVGDSIRQPPGEPALVAPSNTGGSLRPTGRTLGRSGAESMTRTGAQERL